MEGFQHVWRNSRKTRTDCPTGRKRTTVLENETSWFLAPLKRTEHLATRSLENVSWSWNCMQIQPQQRFSTIKSDATSERPNRPIIRYINRKRAAEGLPQRAPMREHGNPEGPQLWNIIWKRVFQEIWRKSEWHDTTRTWNSHRKRGQQQVSQSEGCYFICIK